MAQKTKNALWPTLLIIVFLGMAAAIIYPTEIFDLHGRPVENDKDLRSVDLTVTFSKSPRLTAVQISWGVGGSFTNADTTLRSPWVKTLTGVKPGTKVAVKAQQPFQDNPLGCQIRVNGREVFSDYTADPMREDLVVCVAVVP